MSLEIQMLLWGFAGIFGFCVVVLLGASILEALGEYLDNWKHRRKRG